MSKIAHLMQALYKSPLLWGLLGIMGFYGLIFGGPLDFPLVRRYFTGHPVEYMLMGLFAVALAALILKTFEILGQRAGLAESPLGAKSPGAAGETCQVLLQRLDEIPAGRRNDFFIRRLRSALEHVRSRGTAESLDDELKYLADNDISRLHAGFGLFRVILWAIPILGFLGTVVGITMALNAVDLKSPDQSMLQVLNGLGLKFDTTALALTLSMALMFVHFFVDRAGMALLENVDRRVEEELGGRFEQVSAGPDGQLVAVRRMAETMMQTADRLVQRQAELWQASMESAAMRWANMAKVGGEQLQAWLAGAMSDGLKVHAQHLAAAEQASIEANRRHWEKILQTQGQSIQGMALLQTTVTRQAEVLERVVQAVGEIAQLEDALNRNLNALAGAKHFEQTVTSLAAAINLLNARVAEASSSPAVRLDPHRHAVHAA